MTGSRWILAVLGLWVAFSAFLGFGSEAYMWSNLLAGLLVLVMGVPLVTQVRWEGWAEVVLGLWLVVAAFVPGLREGTGLALNNVFVGLVIGLTALVVPRARVARHA